jgi:hypothetical protein
MWAVATLWCMPQGGGDLDGFGGFLIAHAPKRALHVFACLPTTIHTHCCDKALFQVQGTVFQDTFTPLVGHMRAAAFHSLSVGKWQTFYP